MVHAPQLFTHQRASSMQAAADGTDRDIHDAGDCLVVESFHFAEHQNGAKFVAQPAQRCLDLLSAFGAEQVFRGWIAGIGGVIFPVAGGRVQRDFGTRLPLAIHGRVDGDPIEPGVEGTVAAKGTEFQQGLDKRVLHNIFGFFTLAHDMYDAREEAILIETHEVTEGGGVALKSLFDQLCFTRHVVRVSID